MSPTCWSSAPEQFYGRCVRYRAHAGSSVCAPYEEYIGFGDFMATTGASWQLLILVGWAGKARVGTPPRRTPTPSGLNPRPKRDVLSTVSCRSCGSAWGSGSAGDLLDRSRAANRVADGVCEDPNARSGRLSGPSGRCNDVLLQRTPWGMTARSDGDVAEVRLAGAAQPPDGRARCGRGV
jgi:hypothetical protein